MARVHHDIVACDVVILDVPALYVHPGHVQAYGRRPVCVRLCSDCGSNPSRNRNSYSRNIRDSNLASNYN